MSICTKCDGLGRLSWTDRDAGVCYRCNGTGKFESKAKGGKFTVCECCGKRRLKGIGFRNASCQGTPTHFCPSQTESPEAKSFWRDIQGYLTVMGADGRSSKQVPQMVTPEEAMHFITFMFSKEK